MKGFSAGIGWRTVALALVNVLLLLGIGLRLWKGTETESILRTPARVVKAPALHLDIPPLYTDFRSLADRAPFYASRHLYVQTSPAVSPALPVPKYVFGGAVIRQHGAAVALLNNATSGVTVRVTAGQDLEGWRVESVEAFRVVLRHEGERAEIVRVAKDQGQPGGLAGITRVHLGKEGHVESSSGVRVLGSGQAANRVTTTNLPPLAGSGSGSVYIPAPPH
jgi:hypothetical protein